ncbi:EAL domain-containing protein [uncultured Marinobacter sp.]|uniref:EAL domain-containing protein n=1 Tax=uncultured Marinobacter sp. TaxID=187379 RepID=UPI0030DB8AD3
MFAALQRRLTIWRVHPSMRSLLLMLAALVGLFFSGMLLLSGLNLNYSQQALSELRRSQIEEVFTTGLTRIHARQQILEHYTASLATMGESFHRLAQVQPSSGISAATLRRQLEATLRTQLDDSDGASAAGLWFESGALSPRPYTVYFIRPDNGDALEAAEPAGADGGFRNSIWYQRTLGENWQPSRHQPGTVYWSPVYFDLSTNRAVLTLASPMFGEDGHLIGMATTAWTSQQIIDLISRMTVTENSFSFLNDRNNRNLSSLSQGEDSLREQRIIDAILAENLGAQLAAQTAPSGAGFLGAIQQLQHRTLELDGEGYELYYAITPAGMVYGSGVPTSEIDQVLVPMRDANLRILLLTGAVLLILSLFLLYRIIMMARELQASYTDALTGLPNRSRLLRDLEQSTSRFLIILNVDRFKEINSLFGNRCGDEVLTTLARQLRSYVASAAELERARIYRLPGDEFSILVPLGPDDHVSGIDQLARHLVATLGALEVNWQQQALNVSISAGIARQYAGDQAGSAEHLLSQAKVALLQAREQQRHYLIYNPDQKVEENYEQNLVWARRLKEAVEQDRIVPWFQPIYDNTSKRITKYECLARMIGDDGEVISAGQFLDIADKLRLNRQITRIMIEKSFARFHHQPFDFSINLSYSDLTDPDILRLVHDKLVNTGIGHRVVFEILESDGIGNYDAVLTFIDMVKPFGCRMAIDDFGTGYSNFAHLLRLKVDIIKIDGSLIQHLGEDQTTYRVTSGIVQFATSLGIQTVAEFVHNRNVQARVLELGIDFSQGAWLQMPGPDIDTPQHPQITT